MRVRARLSRVRAGLWTHGDPVDKSLSALKTHRKNSPQETKIPVVPYPHLLVTGTTDTIAFRRLNSPPPPHMRKYHVSQAPLSQTVSPELPPYGVADAQTQPRPASPRWHPSLIPMACTEPLRGWRARSPNPSGRRSIVFDRAAGYEDQEVQVPCGQCMGCRIDKKNEWATRALHEAYCHEENSFLTLTYAPENLPHGLSLVPEHFTRFMKRLRRQLEYHHGKKARYLMCGEYGDKGSLPHYHCLLFGHEFREDRVEFKKSGSGYPLYVSESLSELWPYGYCYIGSVTQESAGYVAGYTTKKLTGKAAEELDENGLKPYELIDKQTGEIHARVPEYARMSRNPGLGANFYAKFGKDIRRDDYAFRGRNRVRVPGFYDSRSENLDPGKHARNKKRRKHEAEKRREGPERRRMKEDYLREQMKRGKYEGF